jgi:hypothetical protein
VASADSGLPVRVFLRPIGTLLSLDDVVHEPGVRQMT